MRILLAEDDEVSRFVVSETLRRWGYDVVCAADGEQAWHLLQGKDAPRLVILDWVMPGMDGLGLCRRIRERMAEPYIYIMMLTARGNKQDIIRGMGAGADDYLTKPCDPQELQMRLGAGRRVINLQAELMEARESLRYMATHDSLTGLVNRAEIMERLRNEIDRSNREGTGMGVLIADIDHFKLVNDTFGHSEGDSVLVEVASRMRSALRSYDTVGRYGGEEFLILLPGCDTQRAEQQAERLRAAIAERPFTLPEGSISVTISIGVIAKECELCDSPSRLVRAADTALYHAKAAGRNQIVIAQQEPEEKIANRAGVIRPQTLDIRP